MSVSARDIQYSRMEEIETYLSTRGECEVEKPTKYKAYLLSGIPRSYIGFNGSIADQINITADMIADAPSYPKELHLSRKALGRIISLRTGHGDLAPYHTRLGHTEANLRCQCESFKTRLYFFYCRILRRRGHRLVGPINLLIPKLFRTAEGAIVLTNWLETTKFYEQICTR